MKILKKLIIIVLIVLISISLVIVQKGYNMYKEAIEKSSLENEIELIKNKKNYTKTEELPKTYINAIIAVEDHRFYSHSGIDIISIGRALIKDIKERRLVEGGSTITQQLAKNMYFSQEKKLTRKVAEVFMAFKIEKYYEKDKILELYLNTSYFGDGYYTVKEAARGYFNKEPIEMEDYESILLAGIINAPSVYSPTKNLDLALERGKQVIDKMIKYKYLTNEEADKILSFK